MCLLFVSTREIFEIIKHCFDRSVSSVPLAHNKINLSSVKTSEFVTDDASTHVVLNLF